MSKIRLRSWKLVLYITAYSAIFLNNLNFFITLFTSIECFFSIFSLFNHHLFASLFDICYNFVVFRGACDVPRRKISFRYLAAAWRSNTFFPYLFLEIRRYQIELTSLASSFEYTWKSSLKRWRALRAHGFYSV